MNIFTQKGVKVYTLSCIFTPGQQNKEYPPGVPGVPDVPGVIGVPGVSKRPRPNQRCYLHL